MIDPRLIDAWKNAVTTDDAWVLARVSTVEARQSWLVVMDAVEEYAEPQLAKRLRIAIELLLGNLNDRDDAIRTRVANRYRNVETL